MYELIVDVTKHSRKNNLSFILFFISMIFAFALTLKTSEGVLGQLLFIPMTFFIYIILATAFSRLFAEDETPEATLIISPKGLKVQKYTGKERHLEWSQIVCIDIFDHGPVRSLRIAPLGFAFKEMLYEEKHLSTSCDEIIQFVHGVCPYGKDISFWNENRK